MINIKNHLLKCTIASAVLCTYSAAFSSENYHSEQYVSHKKVEKVHDLACSSKKKIKYGRLNFKRVEGDLEFTRDYSTGFSTFEAPLWINDILLISHISEDLLPNGATTSRGMGVLFHESGKNLSVSEAFFVADAGANGMITNAKQEVIAGFQGFGAVVNLKNTWHVAMMQGEFVSEGYMGVRYNSPNDLARHTNGTLYITDRDLDAPGVPISLRQAEQRVYTIKTTGEVTSLPDVPNDPDGIYLTKDEDHLYVGGSNGLVRYNVYDDGTVAGVDYSYTLYDNKDRPVSLNNVGGMTMDCSGNILISADEELIVLGEDNNKIVARYPIPGLVNVAFGGKNRNIIVATTKTVMDEYGEKIPPQIYYSFVKGQGMPY